MHTSRYSTSTLHHDGDYDGCMYLGEPKSSAIASVSNPRVELVVTRLMLEELLAGSTAAEIVITAPDAVHNDRHAVTTDSKYTRINEGVAQLATITVARSDLEAIVLGYRSYRIASLLEALDWESVPFAGALAGLESVLATIEDLRVQSHVTGHK